MHETLDKIRKGIEWYEKHSNTASMHDLLRCKDKIVSYNYYIAEQFADFNKSAKIGYGVRKVGIASEINKMTKAGETFTKADSLAIEEKQDIIKDEKLNEAIADSLYIRLKHSDAVVRAIEQRVAVLRKELENSNRENQT
jgi:hypothetical protein